MKKLNQKNSVKITKEKNYKHKILGELSSEPLILLMLICVEKKEEEKEKGRN